MNTFCQKRLPLLDKLIYQTKQQNFRRSFLSVAFAILFALFLSFIVISALGVKPIAFFAMFIKAFDTDYNSQQFMVQMCAYIVAALAFSFSMKVGIFNIGISGQMLAGASTAFLIISTFPDSYNPVGGQMLTLLFSILGATSVALVIGILKIYFRVNEVVSAILLNWIIVLFVGALIYKFDLNETALSNGSFRSNTLGLAFSFYQPGDFFGWGWSIGVTVACVIAIFVILKFTVFGHKLKTTGQSPFAAQNFGYNKEALQLWSFAISGILSGILAVIVYTSSKGRAIDFSAIGGTALSQIPVQGFDGIAIGLIALNNPIAIVIVSFIFSLPQSGAIAAGLPSNTVQLIMGIMMYIIAIYTLLNYFKPWRSLMKYKYSKVNNENYMNLENAIFERNEKLNFECKKIKCELINKKIESIMAGKNDIFAKILKIIFLKPFYSVFFKLINDEYKHELSIRKNQYIEDRKNINVEFKISCIVSIIDHWKHNIQINENNINKMKNKWDRDKLKITRWVNEVSSLGSDIKIVDVGKQFNEIDSKVSLNSNFGGNK